MSDVARTPAANGNVLSKTGRAGQAMGTSSGHKNSNLSDLTAFSAALGSRNAKMAAAQNNTATDAAAAAAQEANGNAKAESTETASQFVSLLNQVKTKLATPQADADENGKESPSKNEGESDAEMQAEVGATATASASSTGASALKSQNGTTSLFATAIMTMNWDAVLTSKEAEGPAAPTAPANDDSAVSAKDKSKTVSKTEVKAEAADSKKDIKAKDSEAPPPVDVKADPQISVQAQVQAVVSNVTPLFQNLAPQVDAKATTKADTPKTVSKVDASSKPVGQIQSAAADDGAADAAMKVVSAAQASGLISDMQVTEVPARDANPAAVAPRDKDVAHKDKDVSAAAAKAQETSATAKIDAGTAVAAAALSGTENASPVSQVVERILQEIPTQNVNIANADQVAQAAKVLTVKLHPEGLGNVMVKISNSGGSLKISVESDSKSTGDQLKSDSSQLLQALQQVMPSFSADGLSFSTNDQPQQDAGAGNANQNAFNGNSGSGQGSGNEGQSYAQQGGRQVPGANAWNDGAADAAAVADGSAQPRAGSLYL